MKRARTRRLHGSLPVLWLNRLAIIVMLVLVERETSVLRSGTEVRRFSLGSMARLTLGSGVAKVLPLLLAALIFSSETIFV